MCLCFDDVFLLFIWWILFIKGHSTNLFMGFLYFVTLFPSIYKSTDVLWYQYILFYFIFWNENQNSSVFACNVYNLYLNGMLKYQNVILPTIEQLMISWIYTHIMRWWIFIDNLFSFKLLTYNEMFSSQSSAGLLLFIINDHCSWR